MLKHGIIYKIVFIACIIIISGCGEKRGTEKSLKKEAVRTRVATASITQEAMIHEATGNVVSESSSIISSKIMGAVTKIHVREGERVNKDQLLLDIDPGQVKAHLLQAEAALSEARKAEKAAISAESSATSAAYLARITHERYSNLMKTESVSRQEFDEVKARLLQAESALAQSKSMAEAAGFRVEQAKAALVSAGINEKDSRILSPYSGVITAKLVEQGSLASPGTPLLKMESSESLRIDMILPENLIHSVKTHQSLSVLIPSASKNAIEGNVKAIIPSADPASRSFTVHVKIVGIPGIYPGMFCRVLIPLKETGKLLIPTTAIIHEGQLTGIFLVASDNAARFRIIRTGRISGDMTEVLSGLKAGDRFVIFPPPNLSDGHIVEVMP